MKRYIEDDLCFFNDSHWSATYVQDNVGYRGATRIMFGTCSTWNIDYKKGGKKNHQDHTVMADEGTITPAWVCLNLCAQTFDDDGFYIQTLRAIIELRSVSPRIYSTPLHYFIGRKIVYKDFIFYGGNLPRWISTRGNISKHALLPTKKTLIFPNFNFNWGRNPRVG